MGLPLTIDVCKKDLFSPVDDLKGKYDDITCARILRLRVMYTWRVGYPSLSDREFIEEDMTRHGISQASAYSDLAIIKQLIPMLNESERSYHRWVSNEMHKEAFQIAKRKNDAKTMATIARDYGKNNRVDLEDEHTVPYDEIVVQPFTATDDPSVLGITKIPNIQEKIKNMLAKYRAEISDIDDVEYEEADLETEELFGEEDYGDE